MSFSFICAALAVIFSLVRYGTYFRAIWRGEARPHLFSWFVLGLVTCIAATAQFSVGGGLSAWALGAVGVSCLAVALSAVFVGEKNITRSDWVALIGALFAIPVWQATDDPVYALYVLIAIDALSFYPTCRKSWIDPWSEPLLSTFLGGLRYLFVLLSVEAMSFDTLIYPIFLMVSDWGLWLMLVMRRRGIRGA